MNIRLAKESDMPAVYMMGYDVWSEGVSEANFLNNCKSSTKYAKGSWYVLECNGELLSSLIVYSFSSLVFGIGSIATPKNLRKQGFASKLIMDVVKALEKLSEGTIIFLYSDIDSKFYKRFGFQELPKSLQKHPFRTCMVKNTNGITITENLGICIPDYF